MLHCRFRLLRPINSPPLPPSRNNRLRGQLRNSLPPGPRWAPQSAWCQLDIGLAGLILLSRMGSGNEYWPFCFPGMILYIAGIGTVYFVGNVTVIGAAKEEHQGTDSGVYNVSAFRICSNTSWICTKRL